MTKKKKRFLTGLIVTILIGVIFCVMFRLDFFSEIHLQSSDFLQRVSISDPKTDSDSKIVIVAIDDRSLEQLGRISSWPREYHAQVVDTLVKAGARIIVFDVLFSEPSDSDDTLVKSIKQAGNVVLPLSSSMETKSPNNIDKMISLVNVIRPLPNYEKSAAAIGHAIMMPDSDGIVRRVPLVVRDDDGYEPALSLTAVAKYLRRPQVIETMPQHSQLSFAGRQIPLNNADSMLINYQSSSFYSSYENISFVDVLKNSNDISAVEGKIVLIGVTAIGFGDTYWTPMGRIMPGVELHARAIDTILSGNFLRISPNWVTILLILLFSILCGLAVLRLPIVWAIVVAFGIVMAYLLTAFNLFDRGFLLDIMYPPISIAGTLMGVTLYSIIRERREKNEIFKTFGRFVSPSVANNILDSIDRGTLKLGGEERVITVLFADARNFTAISEKIGPQELVDVLNRHLSIIIRAILKYGGMVNKFGGDNIMGVWNVPMACPEDALSAIRAAVKAQDEISALKLQSPDLPGMEFGIGINSGKAIAGNMGDLDRLEYSVIGDPVNTAARLTSAAPGGKIWIGAETYRQAEGQINAIQLEPLIVKGKAAPIQAFEIVSLRESAPGK